jgi:hypothetical protein
MGGNLTFEVVGSKQVPVLGLEEKRAFTLVVTIAGSGDLLPFQTVFQGKTNQSVPRNNAALILEAREIGFRFEPSGTGTYWSNLKMMKTWVVDILVPYWQLKMAEFGLQSQECLLQLDVWSVHQSQEFKSWMKENYPWITLEFVVGGCTGIWQPCNTGIQRPLKLSIKHQQQEGITNEVLVQLEKGIAPEDVMFDLTLGHLCDCTVSWLVAAFHEINKPEIVLQVFPLSLIQLKSNFVS